MWLQRWRAAGDDPWSQPSGWRIGTPAPTVVRLRGGERSVHVAITGTPGEATATVEGGQPAPLTADQAADLLTVSWGGRRRRYRCAAVPGQVWLAGERGVALLEEVREAPVRADDEHAGDAELCSPMPGTVVAVNVSDGQAVTAGTVVVAVEAMKMEHALSAPVDGVVELLVAAGEQVRVGQPLARITAHPAEESQPDA